MTDLAQELGIWAAKGAGALAGALISIVYLMPKGSREAACRFFTGVACGLVFGGAAGAALADRLLIADALSRAETMLMGSAAASLCAWWALGVLARVAERWGEGGR